MGLFKNKIILITGGTGSWGYELVRQLLKENPKEIRVLSRNENNQVIMKRTFHFDPRLRFIISDIREKQSLNSAFEHVNYVFHLAALKHVTVCEEQPYEALKTNVIGTQNVIEAALENKVDKVIYISTDKAANPANFYGFTKSIGERLIIHANLLSSHTTFVCVRAGNVLGSNGSVVHIFKQQILENKKISITDKNMTRFFLTLEEAISLLFKAAKESVGGEIFVLKMPSCRIQDLAIVLGKAYGKQVEFEILGVRPGEKIHEILFSEYESLNTVKYDSNYFVILPKILLNQIEEHYRPFQRVETKSYASNEHLMTHDEIHQMLKKGKFIE